MKITIQLLSFCLVWLLSGAALAQESAKPQATPDAHMEAWMKASTPGPEHKLLEGYAGRWNHTVKWWTSADAQPEVSTGTTEIESIFGGRYIRQNVKGTSMGQPFEGLGITGYDNIAKKYTSFWIDSMGTGTMVGTGSFDKAKNALAEEGTFSCPLTPTGKQTFRTVWTLPKSGSYTYEMYAPDKDGKEFKMMEIVYKKAQ